MNNFLFILFLLIILLIINYFIKKIFIDKIFGGFMKKIYFPDKKLKIYNCAYKDDYNINFKYNKYGILDNSNNFYEKIIDKNKINIVCSYDKQKYYYKNYQDFFYNIEKKISKKINFNYIKNKNILNDPLIKNVNNEEKKQNIINYLNFFKHVFLYPYYRIIDEYPSIIKMMESIVHEFMLIYQNLKNNKKKLKTFNIFLRTYSYYYFFKFIGLHLIKNSLNMINNYNKIFKEKYYEMILRRSHILLNLPKDDTNMLTSRIVYNIISRYDLWLRLKYTNNTINKNDVQLFFDNILSDINNLRNVHNHIKGELIYRILDFYYREIDEKINLFKNIPKIKKLFNENNEYNIMIGFLYNYDWNNLGIYIYSDITNKKIIIMIKELLAKVDLYTTNNEIIKDKKLLFYLLIWLILSSLYDKYFNKDDNSYTDIIINTIIKVIKKNKKLIISLGAILFYVLKSLKK